MNSRISTWKYRQARVKYPIRERIDLREDENLELFELEPFEEFHIGNLLCQADEFGQFKFNFMASDEFRCHLGLIPITANDKSGFEVNVLPGKFTQTEFEILKDELQAVWAGIFLDSEGVSAVQAMQQSKKANELWDRRARRALESLLETPPSQLESRPTLVPISRVRQLGTPDVRLVLAKERGLPLQALAPTPTVKSAELYFVRDTLTRLQALAKRQIGYSAPGSKDHFELLETSRSIGKFLRHPTLQVPPTRCRPSHLMSTDRRLRIFLTLRASLAQLDAPIIVGPGDLRLGVKGIDRIYEIWVFMKVLQAAMNIYGQPLSGLENLATQTTSDKLDLHIADGAVVVFPGDIRICFTPSIYTNSQWSWEELDFFPNPIMEKPPMKTTPDVMVLGPNDDAIVIDAKYQARHYIDESTAKVHAKYSRYRRQGRGVVAQVLSAHPHADISYQYAGYSALPFVPGHEIPELPWPKASIPQDALVSPTSVETLLTELVQEHEVPIIPILGQPETNPAATTTRTPTTSRPSTIRWGRNPGVAIIDLAWVFDVMNNRKVDFGRLAKQCQIDRGCVGVVATITRHESSAFINFARQSGWKVIHGEQRQDVLAATRSLLNELTPEEVIMVSNRQDFLDVSQDFMIQSEYIRVPEQFPWVY